jgi:hypothetical protein
LSYNLRAYWEEVNHNNVTDRLEIKELNYSGSTLQLTKSQGFTFSHQEITADSNTGYLNPTYNKILMGVLDFTVWGDDTNTKQLIEDIKSSEYKQFLIEWYNGGQAMWFGFASGRIISKSESEKYLSNIQFRDFEVLKNEFYTKNDSRQKIIKTIADIISELGHNMGTYSGNMLQTFTSWQASGTDVDDDFLNQVYHDTIQLREYGRLGDEEDTDITLFEALKYVCAPQLLIYQMYGAFNVIQLSAFEDPENVLRSDYLLNGTQSNSSLQDLSATIYDTISDGTPIIVQDSENTSYPAIQRVSVDYDHKSLNANINVPKSVQITSPTERKFTMAVRLNGDESIVFSTRNVSRMTIPFSHYTTFTDSDVDVNNDKIEITPSLSIDQKVRLKATAGTVPGGLSEGVDYYMKPKLSDEYGFDTFPYRINNDIDITSDGGSGAVSRVLTIEELTIKNAEFALTLGNTFLDTGTGTFILPGKTYTGMATTLINFTAGDVNTITDTFEILGHGLKDGQLIIFTNAGGSLPGGIDEDEYYYVVNRTIDTYQVSESYGGSVISLTSTGTGAHTSQRASMVRGLSDTSKLAEYVGDFSFELNELLTNQTVELNLHLFPSRTLQVDNMDDEFLDETNWLDTVVQFIDPSNTSSTSITYRLERDTTTGSEILQLAPIRYGDGPFVFSRSAYRTSTNLEDVTTGWRRRGQSTYVDFEKLLLKEVMDTQRGRPSKLNANIIGAYNPRTILIYDAKNYAYVGGVYNSRWRPVLVEINIQEDANDILTEIKKVDPSGNGGIIATNPETEGLTETEADARYLQINNNLDDLESDSTARTNLGLGTGDSPTFAGLTVNGSISVTGNVDGRDVSADGANLDELYTTIGLSALTASEVNQLENIGSTTISATQWGYLGVLDQNLRTTDAVTFSTVDTGQGANELYAMNQDVQTTDDVTFNGLTANGTADLNSTLNVQGVLTTQDNILDDGFSEGWSGTNWRIKADGSAELEELRVRGALRVYEFIAKQISTIGGSEILSIAQGRVSSVNAGADTITVENVTGSAGNSFKAGDLFICQVVDINNDLESGGTGSIVKSVRGEVLSVSGNDIEVSIDAGDITQLEQGDLIIAYGNVGDTDRQAIMYRNVDRSEDNLIMRLQTGITEFSKLQAVANTRVAFGDLNGYSGLSSETFGFFAGDNSNEHILVTDGGLFLKDGGTTLAQLTSNTFKVGDATNYLSFDGTNFDLQSQDFKLSAGELVIDSSLDKKIVISNATEEIIAIGDFDFGAEVEDTSTASASSSSTTATITSATPTNSDTNMDTGVGTLNSNVAQDSPIVTLSRTYNVTGKWVRVQFDYNAPPFDDSAFNEYAVGFSITYFGEQIQELNRNPEDSSAVSGSVDKTLFVPDTATFNTIQVQSLASSGGLSSSDEHSKINVSNLSVTVYDDTYSYTDIGNDGFRVYNSGGRKKIEFKDGNATATLDQLSIGSWDFELASNGDLVLKYEGTTVQTFTKP